MNPTLDQLSVFLAVVEADGFSAAARRLNRQQSAISYAIASLEGQLGVALFDRTVRRPILTDAGRAILEDARRVAREVDGLKARAKALNEGLEAELSVVVDAMVSEGLIVRLLGDFRREFPTVGIRLAVEALGAVPANVLDRSCQLGISGPLFYRVDDLEEERLGSTSLLPVAATTHPLAQLPGPIPTAKVRKYDQVVLTDRSTLSHGRDFAVITAQPVYVTDMVTKHYLILAGLGWGNLPADMVEADLASGRLVHLPLAQWRERPYPFHGIHRADSPPGPAGRWFVATFARYLTEPTRNGDVSSASGSWAEQPESQR